MTVPKSTQSGEASEIGASRAAVKQKSWFWLGVHRFLFDKWRVVRSCVFCVINGQERKKIPHKFAVWCSYWVNAAWLRFKLWRVRSKDPKRRVVAICQAVHLGDIVACEPVIRCVKDADPGAFIVFAVQKNYRGLPDSHPDVGHTLALQCISEWIKFARSRQFDRVVDLNIYGRTCGICGIPWMKPNCNNRVTIDNYYSFSSLLTAFASGANIEVKEDGPRVYISSKDIHFVDKLNLPGQYVCLHAASNEVEREFPAGEWKKAVDHLNRKWKMAVVEIGLKAVMGLTSPNRDLCGRLSIIQSAEVIRRSALYLGSDSGPAHLANAVGAYGIILLGSYRNFPKYLPYTGNYAEGRHCQLLYHNGPVAGMPPENILSAIDRRMAELT